MGLEKLDNYMQNNQTGLFFIPYTNIYSKRIKYLNVRLETTKLLEEAVHKLFFDIGPSNIFGQVSYKGKQSKNKQTGLHKTKKLLYNEGNYQQNKRQPAELQKIFANDIYLITG